MAKLTEQQIKKTVEEAGFVFISSDGYTNLSSPLEVRCVEKHLQTFSISQLRRKPKCSVCEEQVKLQATEKNVKDLPKKKGYRILGIDGATKISGFCVIEEGELVHYGIKEMSDNSNIIARIVEMRHWLIAVIKRWQIDEVVIEDVYMENTVGGVGPQTMIKLSKLLGVLEVSSYEALDGKVQVVSVNSWRGHLKVKTRPRNAAKESAQKLVKDKFGIVVSFDCADAICIGLYGWFNRKAEYKEFVKLGQ